MNDGKIPGSRLFLWAVCIIIPISYVTLGCFLSLSHKIEEIDKKLDILVNVFTIEGTLNPR